MKDEELKSGFKIPLLEEVESQLDELLRKRKEEIERELEERIRQEREEAEKKIRDIEQEFERGRELLLDYWQILADFEAERTRLQEEIRERFSRVIQHQSEIERLASLTLEEIKQVDELNQKLESLEQKSGEKIALIRRQIEEKYGIVTEAPEIPSEGELKLNIDQELERLRKIKELLAGEVARTGFEERKEEGPPQAAEEKEAQEKGGEQVREPITEPISEAETTGLEEVGVKQPEAEIVGPPVVEPEIPEEVPPGEPSAGEAVETFREVYERLENYRRAYSEGNGEIPYFEKEGRLIIDAESLVASMNEALEDARRLYTKLAQTDSPKDHFFIKQEIINQQEILRKQLLRVTKLCEKEGFSLPRFTEEILNISLVKDLLERLSIENWSDETDFQAMTEFVESLKEAFYRKITPPVAYLKAVLRELGAA